MINPTNRNRLGDAWERVCHADRRLTLADLAFDRSRVVATGNAVLVNPESPLATTPDNLQERAGAAQREYDDATAELLTLLSDMFGDEGASLGRELKAAIEACYEPTGTSFRAPIEGVRGEEQKAALQGVKDRVDTLAGGTPVLVDPGPHD